MQKNSESTAGKFRSMRVGESRAFPLQSLSYVRVAASVIGAELDRRYKTHVDRAQRVIRVTRTK